MVVFFAFHVYWEFGGRFGFGDQTDPLPDRGGSIAMWLFTVLTLLAFPVGALVALVTVQPWGRKIPRRLLLSLLWAGSLVLVLRGGGSMLEDLLQATGALQDGFTGLSQEQVRSPKPLPLHHLVSPRHRRRLPARRHPLRRHPLALPPQPPGQRPSAAQAAEVITGDAYQERVLASTAQAQSIGITGIPAFLLDGRFLVLGAQPRGVFEHALAG